MNWRLCLCFVLEWKHVSFHILITASVLKPFSLAFRAHLTWREKLPSTCLLFTRKVETWTLLACACRHTLLCDQARMDVLDAKVKTDEMGDCQMIDGWNWSAHRPVQESSNRSVDLCDWQKLQQFMVTCDVGLGGNEREAARWCSDCVWVKCYQLAIEIKWRRWSHEPAWMCVTTKGCLLLSERDMCKCKERNTCVFDCI